MAERNEPRRRAQPSATTASAAVPADSGAVFHRCDDGRVRAVIDALSPVVDGGRFPAKRIAGEPVCIEAHCFTDGHDQLRVVLAWRAVNAAGGVRGRDAGRGGTTCGRPSSRRPRRGAIGAR